MLLGVREHVHHLAQQVWLVSTAPLTRNTGFGACGAAEGALTFADCTLGACIATWATEVKEARRAVTQMSKLVFMVFKPFQHNSKTEGRGLQPLPSPADYVVGIP